MKKVSIGIILYNSEKYLPFLLPSILNQDYTNIEFLIRDQSPNYECYEYIKKHYPEVFEKIEIYKAPNRLHSGGHNDLINQMTGDYYICASFDMYYEKDFISNIVKELDKPENFPYLTATCKLYYWDFPKLEKDESLIEQSKTKIIDSCGLGVNEFHHFVDRGQGKVDVGQYDNDVSIFGATGALIIFRKEALEKIQFINKNGKKEYFDELMHYKNDVDMAYRFQWMGEKCLFLPHVRAYHFRQVSQRIPGLKGLIIARREKTPFSKKSSYIGNSILMHKNYSSDFSWKIRLKTFLRGFIEYIYILLFESYILKEKKFLKQNEEEIMSKKKAVQKKVSVTCIEHFMKIP